MTGVDACRRGWVAVSIVAPDPAGGPAGATVTVRTGPSLGALLDGRIVGIDMPLGLLAGGWREADRIARGLLGPRRSSVFAIPPRAVWDETSYHAALRRCRELTGQGFSVQAWGLRAKLLEANACRVAGRHELYEVHPELAFAAMAGGPLADSKHTAAGHAARHGLLTAAGIAVPGGDADVLDAAAVAWSALRIARGAAAVIPDPPQYGEDGREIVIRY